MSNNKYSQITPEIMKLTELCYKNSNIDPSLYEKYDVKRGLRDLNGKGVVTGLTEISDIRSSYTDEDGNTIPSKGKLYYRGIDVEDLIRGSIEKNHFCYEETAYLLLFGQLPTREQLNEFMELLAFYRTLPTNFVRDIILKAPSANMMNTLARSVLTLYAYDEKGDDISIAKSLISKYLLVYVHLIGIVGSKWDV
jgi:citrate synthase